MTRALIAVVCCLAAGYLPAAARSAEPVHHDIHLRLAPEDGRLDASDRITVGGRRDAITLTLAPGLELRRVLLDGRPVPVERGRDGWRIPLGDRSRHELAVEYGGSVTPDDGGERPEAFGRLLLGAEGGFLPAGAGWMPAIPGDGDEPITFRVTVEVPEPYKAIATGRLVGEDAADGVYPAEFTAERPMEAPSVFVGPYVVAERVHGGVALRTYFYDEEAHLAEVYLEQAAGYLELFQERIGPYPYDAFRIVAAPLPVGLGFPGLTYVSRRILHLPFMQTGSLAHELLHNWWGSAVRVDYRRGNWAEGLTTFMADYALAEAEGPEAAREMRLAWLRDFAALPPERDVPLTDFVAKGHDAAQVVGYGKAAFVFHMLRDRLGPAAFDAGIRLFWDRHRFGSAAAWEDLRASFEAASGRDLSEFFEQWLHRSGAPRLRLDEVEATSLADGGYEVALTLRQDPRPYALAVPVTVETAAGLERARIELRGAEATTTVRVAAPPLVVSVDPDYELFRHLVPGEAPPIVRDVTLNPNALAVIAVGDDEAAAGMARELAGRMMDTGVRTASPDDPRIHAAPLLVIGLTAEVERVLAGAGFGAAPEPLAGRGTARSWVARRMDGLPLLVVEAEDAEALRSLLRPLPHYRRSSFLVFEGREAVAEGVWPSSGDHALSHRLEPAAPPGEAPAAAAGRR